MSTSRVEPVSAARARAVPESRHEEDGRAVSSLEAAAEIARAAAGDDALPRVLELVAERARELLEAGAAAVLLADGEDLVVAAVAGSLDGRPAGSRIRREALAGETGAVLAVPLDLGGGAPAMLVCFDRAAGGSRFEARDELLLGAFASTAAATYAAAADARSSALRRSIAAAERERSRWARELHDETLEELAAVKLVLAAARAARDERDREAQLEEMADRVADVAARLRKLVSDLRPAALDDLGLGRALEDLAVRVRVATGLAVDLDVELAYESGAAASRLTPEIENTLYRVVQEALADAARHAGAERACVVVRERRAAVEVTILDRGRAFDPDAPSTAFATDVMRERVALVGGTVAIESSNGSGTEVRASLPVRRLASWSLEVAAAPA